MTRGIERLLLGTLPPGEREALEGDLTEEGLPSSSRCRALFGVALRFQLEPYRDPAGRTGAVALVVAGLLLLRVIPAAGSGEPDPALYSGPFLTVLSILWNGWHVTAAVASGLVMGHAPLLPGWAWRARLHGVIVLAAFALGTAGTTTTAVLAVFGLGLAAWFGFRARSDGPIRRPA